MLIDTNIYSALDNNIKAAVEVLRGQTNVFLPFVAVAELRYGFLNGANQKENETRLNRFLAQDGVEVLNSTLQTTKLYAELALYCKKRGRALTNNDVWIAALAKENDLRLVTFDQDFAVFEELFIGKLTIL